MKVLSKLMLVLIALLLVSCQANFPNENAEQNSGTVLIPENSNVNDAFVLETSPEELGNPSYTYYGDHTCSRNVWDMIIYDGKLYIGCGDADENTGPCPLFSYDLQTYSDEVNIDSWKEEAFLPDECIFSFKLLGDTLVVPGCDPIYQGYTSKTGTFYFLQDDQWRVMDTLPNAAHNYDIVLHEEAWYAALSVKGAYSPFVRSKDQGETWEQLPLFDRGEIITFSDDSTLRAFQLFQLNGELYAFFYSENQTEASNRALFQYQENAFHKIEAEWIYELTREEMRNVEFNGKLFLVNEKLFVSENMLEGEAISLPIPCQVMDVFTKSDALYVLATRKVDQNLFNIYVYSSTSGDAGSFVEEVSFQYGIPMRSFELYNDTFYFGTGSEFLPDILDENKNVVEIAVDNDNVGTILRVQRGTKIKGKT